MAFAVGIMSRHIRTLATAATEMSYEERRHLRFMDKVKHDSWIQDVMAKPGGEANITECRMLDYASAKKAESLNTATKYMGGSSIGAGLSAYVVDYLGIGHFGIPLGIGISLVGIGYLDYYSDCYPHRRMTTIVEELDREFSVASTARRTFHNFSFWKKKEE